VGTAEGAVGSGVAVQVGVAAGAVVGVQVGVAEGLGLASGREVWLGTVEGVSVGVALVAGSGVWPGVGVSVATTAVVAIGAAVVAWAAVASGGTAVVATAVDVARFSGPAVDVVATGSCVRGTAVADGEDTLDAVTSAITVACPVVPCPDSAVEGNGEGWVGPAGGVEVGSTSACSVASLRIGLAVALETGVG
jgi:hypothetical protein